MVDPVVPIEGRSSRHEPRVSRQQNGREGGREPFHGAISEFL